MAFTATLPVLDSVEKDKQPGARTSTPTAIRIDSIRDAKIEPLQVLALHFAHGAAPVFLDLAVEEPGSVAGISSVPPPSRFSPKLAVSLVTIPASEANKSTRAGQISTWQRLGEIKSLLSGVHVGGIHVEVAVLNEREYIDLAASASAGFISEA